MNTQSTLKAITTFAAAMVIGCGAVVAIGGASASTVPAARATTTMPSTAVAPAPVVHLDPVVVTMSRARFEALREQLNSDTAIARDDASRPGAHG